MTAISTVTKVRKKGRELKKEIDRDSQCEREAHTHRHRRTHTYNQSYREEERDLGSAIVMKALSIHV